MFVLEIIILVALIFLAGVVVFSLRISSDLRDKVITMASLLQNQHQHVDSLSQQLKQDFQQFQDSIYRMNNDVRDKLEEFKLATHQQFNDIQQRLQKQQLDSLDALLKNLTQGIQNARQQLTENTTQNSQLISVQMEKLNKTVHDKLLEISGQVEKRLTEGFEKTTATFTDIIKRLAIIDEAQKRITELSTNVVSLQEILSDKKSRGAFGEVQLSALVRNMLAENSFSLQHTLSNGMRADCILFLPPPTGNIVIDAKFPLEAFRLNSETNNEKDKQNYRQQFKKDIQKHIFDIAQKYIIPGETADGAMMFIPAEAIFAEIHANFPELVELAQREKVWLVSPTTMMAVLTTVRAVLKDDATRQQVNIIQEHLRKLAKNFDLFKTRMDKLSQHIRLANQDVDQINTSAQKITTEFEKIERVELEDKSTTT